MRHQRLRAPFFVGSLNNSAGSTPKASARRPTVLRLAGGLTRGKSGRMGGWCAVWHCRRSFDAIDANKIGVAMEGVAPATASYVASESPGRRMLVAAETMSRRSPKAAALLLLTHSQIVPSWRALAPAKLIHNAHPALRAIQVEACWLAPWGPRGISVLDSRSVVLGSL